MVYSPEMRLLAVGYLQVGFGGHGICLYGRKMAQEFAGRSDVKVIERNLLLTGNLIGQSIRLSRPRAHPSQHLGYRDLG